MEKLNVYTIDWKSFRSIHHDTFGKGEFKDFYIKEINNVKIPFVTLKFKDFECNYLVADWDTFYSSYSSINVDVTIGRKVKHIKFGEGVIKKVDYKNDQYYVTISFNGVEKL